MEKNDRLKIDPPYFTLNLTLSLHHQTFPSFHLPSLFFRKRVRELCKA